MSEHHPMIEALSYSPDPFIADVAAELDRLHAENERLREVERLSRLLNNAGLITPCDARMDLVAALAANKNHSPKGTK